MSIHFTIQEMDKKDKKYHDSTIVAQKIPQGSIQSVSLFPTN